METTTEKNFGYIWNMILVITGAILASFGSLDTTIIGVLLGTLILLIYNNVFRIKANNGGKR